MAKLPRKTFSKFAASVGGDEWSPHGCQVAVMARSTCKILFLLTSASYDTPNCWTFPSVGVSAGESAQDAASRALAKDCGYIDDRPRLEGYLRYHHPRGHVGLLTPLVVVPDQFNPHLLTSDFVDFQWCQAMDVIPDGPMTYALNEILDHPFTLDLMSRVISRVR